MLVHPKEKMLKAGLHGGLAVLLIDGLLSLGFEPLMFYRLLSSLSFVVVELDFVFGLPAHFGHLC